MNTETMPCPKCGQESPFRLRDDVQHHGEIKCPTHGHMWISKPTELKTVRRKVNRDLFELVPDDMQDHCWICLRDRALLKSLQPMLPLEAHHIIEVKDGGADVRDNIMIACKECHSGIHRVREAFNRYNTNNQ